MNNYAISWILIHAVTCFKLLPDNLQSLLKELLIPQSVTSSRKPHNYLILMRYFLPRESQKVFLLG